MHTLMDKQSKGFLKDQNSNRANGLVIDNLDSDRILQDIKHSPLNKESVSTLVSFPHAPPTTREGASGKH